MQHAEPEKPTPRPWIRPLGFLFNIGWYISLSLVIPTGIGYWFDQPARLDSQPLFTLIGFGLGTIIAFYGFYRMLRRFLDEQKEQNTHKGVGESQ